MWTRGKEVWRDPEWEGDHLYGKVRWVQVLSAGGWLVAEVQVDEGDEEQEAILDSIIALGNREEPNG